MNKASHHSDLNATVITAGSPCKNCNSELTGKYCSACGQKSMDAEEYSLKHFLAHALHDFTHFDSKFFKSIRTLFTRPGKITLDYLEGRRSTYMQPVQLYIIANLVFFIIVHHTQLSIFSTSLNIHLHASPYKGLAGNIIQQHLAKTHESYTTYESRFNENMLGQAKSLIVLMVPLFALVNYALYSRRGKYYVQHLVYGLHFYTAVLLSLFTVIPLVAYILAIPAGLLINVNVFYDNYITFIASALMCTYLYISARKVFKGKSLPTLAKSIFITYCWFMILSVYRFILFFTVFLLT